MQCFIRGDSQTGGALASGEPVVAASDRHGQQKRGHDANAIAAAAGPSARAWAVDRWPQRGANERGIESIRDQRKAQPAFGTEALLR